MRNSHRCFDVLGALAKDGGEEYTCGARIDYLVEEESMSRHDAQVQVGGEFPEACGACAKSPVKFADTGGSQEEGPTVVASSGCSEFGADAWMSGTYVPCCEGFVAQSVPRQQNDPLRSTYPEVTLCLLPCEEVEELEEEEVEEEMEDNEPAPKQIRIALVAERKALLDRLGEIDESLSDLGGGEDSDLHLAVPEVQVRDLSTVFKAEVAVKEEEGDALEAASAAAMWRPWAVAGRLESAIILLGAVALILKGALLRRDQARPPLC